MYRFECQTCGACLDVADHDRATTCSYCASPSVIERPAEPDRPNPSFAIGFTVPQARALEHAQTWIRRALLAPGRFRKAAIDSALEGVRGVYVPAYLYTAAAYSYYRAEIGEAFTEEERYTAKDERGEPVEKTRRVTRHEWRSLSGDHAVYISDDVVTASRGLPDRELQGVTPFDLRALQRYAPALISGWAAEEPSLTTEQSLAIARVAARDRLRTQIDHFMPGDLHRLVRTETEFCDEHMELALLPLWVLPVRYDPDKEPVRLLVNGQTGRVWGRAPISLFKVLSLAALVIAAAVLIYMYAPPGG